MLERFVKQTKFASQEDFVKNLKIEVPENFNFGYDVVMHGLPNSRIRRLSFGQMTKE